jgi:hypothetical protein
MLWNAPFACLRAPCTAEAPGCDLVMIGIAYSVIPMIAYVAMTACLPACAPCHVQEYLAVDSSPEALLVCGWSDSGGAAWTWLLGLGTESRNAFTCNVPHHCTSTDTTKDVSGVGRRNYAVGETYVAYGVGRKMAP